MLIMTRDVLGACIGAAFELASSLGCTTSSTVIKQCQYVIAANDQIRSNISVFEL